jgi:DNA-directed RNA polymerase specialized sigma24 family protein
MARWSRFAPSADRRLVKGLHDGDEGVLATLYDVYAERLYDYSMALLDDSKAAADVVHDTFIDATRRAPRMRERGRLRPWLYAGARRRCLQRKRETEPEKGDPLARLDFLHREVLFLVLRHDVTDEDLATTLGISTRKAHARLVRAEQLVPEAISFLDTAPAPALPSALRYRVKHTGTDPELAGYRTEIAARGGPLTPDGMPRQPDAPSPLARRWAFASAGSLAALCVAAMALVSIGPNLPVPDIRWPGEPQRPKVPSPSHAPSGPDNGKFGPGRQQPRTEPELIPSHIGSPPIGSPPRSQPGRLTVSPLSIHFSARDKVASLSLRATGGSVTWSASASTPMVTLSRAHGGISGGHRTTVQVRLTRGILTLPGSGTITVVDGTGHDFAIGIAWDVSLL